MSGPSQSAFQLDKEVLQELEAAQWTFHQSGDSDVYELRLALETPAAITAEKANAPAIGLPTLDGFLSYVAFRAAVSEVLSKKPDLSRRVLWQWNVALRNSDAWIDFQIPIEKHTLQGYTLYDCSVGLPTREGETLVPAGNLFTLDGKNFEQHPTVMNSIPLRRRVADPFGRPIELKGKPKKGKGMILESGFGKTKALDNRLYFPLTQSYSFLFRGNKAGVEKLLAFAVNNRIGLGKKTTLGFGQISSFEISQRTDIKATWTQPISIVNKDRLALIKSIPFDLMFSEKDRGGLEAFLGCRKFSLQAVLETFGSYRPPYWLRERRTQIMRYGSVIQPR